MVVPWSRNMLENPSAEEGMADWTEVSNVSAVSGGVDADYCFKFGNSGSMKQMAGIPGQPPELFFECWFLPGQDVASAAQVLSEVVITLHYGDGTEGRYTIPTKDYA